MGSRAGLAASEHYGQVTFGGLPVPGATVTASQGDKQFVTITDQQGVYKIADLADGVWTIRVDMLGFSPSSQDVTVAAGSQPSSWELKLMPFEEIARTAPPQPVPSSFQRAAATATVRIHELFELRTPRTLRTFDLRTLRTLRTVRTLRTFRTLEPSTSNPSNP